MSDHLRPYQRLSIESLRSGIQSGHKHQILCAATGAGKSIIATELIRLCKEKGSRALFVVDRRVLVDQFSRHLDNYGIDHGVLMAKHYRFRPHEKVQVASVQTLERMESWPRFDILIIDEIHACHRESLRKMIASMPNVRTTGLTATPFTKGLGKTFSNVVNVITMRELVDQGYLVPFRVFIAHEIDTTGIKIVGGEFKKDELESKSLTIVGDVVADYINISTRTWGETRKTIVFCSGVAHGKELVRRFAEIGKNFISISYEDDEDYKTQILADFARPDTDIDGLISTDILTRGFDVTDIEHVILARPLRKSLSLHIQMIGRGARPHPGKEFCVIQDNSGNYLRFKDDYDDVFSNGVHELDDGKEKPKKELTKKEKEAAKCPKCSALWQGRTDTCPLCGFVRDKKSAVEAVAGEIKELADSPKKERFTPEFKEAFYSELLHYAISKGYSPGWAAWKFKERFSAFPHKKKGVSPRQPSPETLAYIKHLAIKAAKSK